MVNRPTIDIGVWLPGSLRSAQFLAPLSGNRRAVSRLRRSRFSRGVFSSVWRLETRFGGQKATPRGLPGISTEHSGIKGALAGGILFRRVKIFILSGSLWLVLWVKHACNMLASEATGWHLLLVEAAQAAPRCNPDWRRR